MFDIFPYAQDVTIWYDIFLGFFMLGFIGLLVYTLWLVSITEKKPKDFTVNEFILVLNAICCIDRVIWILGILNGRDKTVLAYGTICECGDRQEKLHAVYTIM